MSFIDNIIGIISPKRAFERARYRAASKVMDDQFRKFDAASRGRRTAGWGTVNTSINTETAVALPALRSRSRDLVNNNPYAKKAIQVIVANTVGTGIQPGISTIRSNGKTRVEATKELWRKWAETTECDFDGQRNFYGIQRQAMRTIAEAGEVLILRRRKTGGTLPIQLQLLEPDHLDIAKDIKQLTDSGFIKQGVEFNKDGQRVAYWIHKDHPGEDGYLTSERIPAEDVLHVYDVLRPGQVRGIPFGTSAMLRLKDFDDYEDAELVRQKIAACFAVFVEDADPSSSVGSSDKDAGIERVEPGIIEHLPPGKRMTFASPPTTQNYDNYSRKILQAIASGYGITYEAMTGDLSNVNFSSGRMGWLEMHRQLSDWQYNMLIPMLCDRVWGWFVDAAVIATSIRMNDMKVTWTPPRREMIDPLKETQAIQLQARTGVRSMPEIMREQGYEPDQVLQEIKEFNAKLDEYGIILDTDPRKSQGTKLTADPEQPAGSNQVPE